MCLWYNIMYSVVYISMCESMNRSCSFPRTPLAGNWPPPVSPIYDARCAIRFNLLHYADDYECMCVQVGDKQFKISYSSRASFWSSLYNIEMGGTVFTTRVANIQCEVGCHIEYARQIRTDQQCMCVCIYSYSSRTFLRPPSEETQRQSSSPMFNARCVACIYNITYFLYNII